VEVFGPLVSSVLAAVGYLALRTERRRAADGIVVPGAIVGHEWRKGAGTHNRTVARPVVEVVGPDGQVLRFTDDFGTASPPKPGKSVAVRFSRTRPELPPVLDGTLRVLLPTVLMVAGSVGILGALGVLAAVLLP
jgi:hypothetical protein